MRQERKDTLKSSEKFEDGVLRADACAERYSISRDSQYRTSLEDLPSYSFGSSAVREENRLLRQVHRLRAYGYLPHPWESLEEFVQRYRDVLEEVF
ncbi:MAG: hypothetical protein AMJ78_00695 [Omnitrophica WOR_2 bacterium SM23_29]|nr:MAG: hypothetical protein AMJ78_00695 [Omnitrophica WOR_2 bacterium SM23_29]